MENKTKKIVIYHSNDIHSRLENGAKIATIIEEGCREYGANQVLAVDIGDHMDRARMETEGTDGLLHRAIIEQTGYELVTLGNNEGLTFSKEQLDEIYGGETSFKVICCNIHSADGNDPSWLLPYYVKEQNGIKLGFIAATANFHMFYLQIGWKTEEPIAAIAAQVERIREQVDVVILMSHLGIRLDEEIATRDLGIDIILGAHTHHLFDPPKKVENTLLCAAGKFGMYVGKVMIEYRPEEHKYCISGECIPTASYEANKPVMDVLKKYGEIAKSTLQRPIVTLASPMQASYTNESALPNLLAIGLRKCCDAEIGLVNSGQLLAGLAIGQVTAGELHAICPSPINPCKVKLRGQEILIALEQSLLPQFIDMKIVGFGFRGEQLGSLAVDGMDIVYDPSRPDFHKIVSVEVNGKALNLERYYEVGTIDMFTFKIGYETLANYKEVTYFLPQFIRHVIEDELNNVNSVEYAHYKRWHIGN